MIQSCTETVLYGSGATETALCTEWTYIGTSTQSAYIQNLDINFSGLLLYLGIFMFFVVFWFFANFLRK